MLKQPLSNVNVGKNFRTITDKDFTIGMHSELIKPFHMTQRSTRARDVLLNITCNNISVIYVMHIYVQTD